jgi:hypothetical protein
MKTLGQNIETETQRLGIIIILLGSVLFSAHYSDGHTQHIETETWNVSFYLYRHVLGDGTDGLTNGVKCPPTLILSLGENIETVGSISAADGTWIKMLDIHLLLH